MFVRLSYIDFGESQTTRIYTISTHKRNNMKKWIAKLWRKALPAELWTRRFVVAVAGAFATILWFDFSWSVDTSFRGTGFVAAYLFGAMLALLMSLPAVWCKHRWPMAVVLVVADCLCIANLMYVRTYFMPIPPMSYLLVRNVAEFGPAIVQSFRMADALFFVITIATIWLMGRSPRPLRRRAYWPTLGVVVAVCLLQSLFNGGVFAHIEKLKGLCYYRAMPPVIYTLPVNILADALESNRPISEADKADAKRWLNEAADLRSAMLTDSVERRYEPRNLALIIVESLEAWTIGAIVEEQAITPRLNEFLADTASTWMARRVLSQEGPGRSIDGQLLITSGMLPLTDFVYSMRFSTHTYPHLLHALQKHWGAKSYFLVGDRPTTWNQGPMTQNYGFDVARFRDSWDNSESVGLKGMPSDRSFLRQVAEAMRNSDIWPVGESAMVETITYSSHFPFHIPDEYLTINLRNDYPELLGEYIRAVNYVDSALGEYIDYLRSRPDADSTMIVIVGDHEALTSMRTAVRDYSPVMAAMVDGESYVPMIVLNSPVAGRRDEVMGQVDVYSTILDLIGMWGADDVFPGLGYSVLRPTAPCWAIDADGYVAGDTVGANPALLKSVLTAPRASSTIIRANLLGGK